MALHSLSFALDFALTTDSVAIFSRAQVPDAHQNDESRETSRDRFESVTSERADAATEMIQHDGKHAGQATSGTASES